MPPSLMSMICPSSATPAPAGIAQCKGISGGTGARGCARSWRLTVTLGKLMRIARVPSSVTSTGSEAGNSMCIPPNSATKVTCWRSSSAGIALPPESGSTTMYCLIGSTKRSFHCESAPPARRAASGSRRGTSAPRNPPTPSPAEGTGPGHRVLGGGLGRAFRAGRVRDVRAVVDDGPAARGLALHDLERLLRAQEHASEIGVHHGLPLLEREVLEHDAAGRADSGVVEEHVEPPELFLRRGEQRPDRFLVGDVGRHDQRARSRSGVLRGLVA